MASGLTVLAVMLTQVGSVSAAPRAAFAEESAPTMGHLEVTEPWGDGVTEHQARILAVARVWLDGLEACAGRLAGRSVVRLAELGPLRRQALAALAGAVEISFCPPVSGPSSRPALGPGCGPENMPAEDPGAPNTAPKAASDMPAGEASGVPPCAAWKAPAPSDSRPQNEKDRNEGSDGANAAELPSQVTARAVWREPSATELSSLLGRTDALDRMEEALLVLWRLLPEAQDLAARERELRRQGTEHAARSERVRQLIMKAEACLSAACAFAAGGAEDPSVRVALDRAFSLAPDLLFLRLLRAEELLRDERPQAALELLAGVKAPAILMAELPAATSAFPDGSARRTSGKAVDLSAFAGVLPGMPSESWLRNHADRGAAGRAALWRPQETDSRLYARALHLRALALLRTGKPALAGAELDDALRLAPHWADLWAARGATFQVREMPGPMCADYHQACALGRCDALAAARARGLCLPPATEGAPEGVMEGPMEGPVEGTGVSSRRERAAGEASVSRDTGRAPADGDGSRPETEEGR